LTSALIRCVPEWRDTLCPETDVRFGPSALLVYELTKLQGVCRGNMYLLSRLVNSDKDLCSADQAVNRCVYDVKLLFSTTPLSTQHLESLLANWRAREKARLLRRIL
jgi:hypothetical protein